MMCVRYDTTVKTNKINRCTYEKSVNLLLPAATIQLLFCCLFSQSYRIEREVYSVYIYSRNANIRNERNKQNKTKAKQHKKFVESVSVCAFYVESYQHRQLEEERMFVKKRQTTYHMNTGVV